MSPASTPSHLQARGISTWLGSNLILNDLDLPDLHRGHIVALLGPNGSGKSTLLKSLAGIIPGRAGLLALGTRNLRTAPASSRAELMRYLPQSLPSDVHLTVTEAILVALKARRPATHGEAMIRVESTLNELGIAQLGRRYLDELSGGQKQLVGLAQAIIHKPEVLLLDEPLASLDMNYQHHVMQLLLRLTREWNLLTIIVLHDLDMALRYADKALLMRQGALVASGVPEEVITPDTLARTFSIRTRIERCSYGKLHVFVDDLIQI